MLTSQRRIHEISSSHSFTTESGCTPHKQFGFGALGHSCGRQVQGQQDSSVVSTFARGLMGCHRFGLVHPYVVTMGIPVVAAICVAPVSTVTKRSVCMNTAARSTRFVSPQKFWIGTGDSAMSSSAYARSPGAPTIKNAAAYRRANSLTT